MLNPFPLLRRLTVFLLLVGTTAFAESSAPAHSPAPNEAYAPLPILPGGLVLPLYATDSPRLNRARLHEAEKYNMTPDSPGRIQSIVNIHNPSLELHKADSRFNTGAAIIVIAGGGHRTLNVGTEGGDLVPYFYNYGINTVILRNRLRADGYSAETDAVNDTLAAVRLVRTHATAWGIDPAKIGVMGFSAGAELAGAAAVFYENYAKDNPADISARPDFVGLLYPGPTPFTRDPATPIPTDTPPTFIASAGSGDRVHAIWADQYFAAMLKRGVPNLEMHIYGNGVHADGLKDRGGIPFGKWQDRFMDWFRDLGFLAKPGIETRAIRDVGAFAAKKS